MIELWVITPEDWRAWRELRLTALREAPYAYGSTLAQWQGTGDTEDRWRARLSSVAFNVIAKFAGAAAGIVSGTAPFARGHAVGDELVDAVSQWSRIQQAMRVDLAVVPNNTYAIVLYERHGFTRQGIFDGELKMVLTLNSGR